MFSFKEKQNKSKARQILCLKKSVGDYLKASRDEIRHDIKGDWDLLITLRKAAKTMSSYCESFQMKTCAKWSATWYADIIFCWIRESFQHDDTFTCNNLQYKIASRGMPEAHTTQDVWKQSKLLYFFIEKTHIHLFLFWQELVPPFQAC